MNDWKKLEALLFASGKYLTEEQLIVLSGITKNKIKKALKELKNKYEEKDTSLAIYNEADTWKLNVKEEYTDVIKEVVSDAEMPRAVMETLAIIAYKSPVLQSEIKDIRGTTVYDHIPLLETKGFIKREKHGRSYKIRLTSKFHEYFDIEGDSKLAELFKDVKKPEKPKKLGDLEVYNEDNGAFDEKIIERMKKLEKKKEDHEEENNFLNNFEEKYEKTKKNIDDSEQDIASFRKKTDEDSKDIFGEEHDEQEDKQEEKSEEEPEDSDDEETEEKPQESEVEEKNEDIPEFLKKVNKQIDDLTKGKTDIEKTEEDEDEDKKEESDDEQETQKNE